VAGLPESYFRQPDQMSWARRWGITVQPGGAFNYADHVQTAMAAGRTGNGVRGEPVAFGRRHEPVRVSQA
jgi:LPS sulfotransferase NodH